jgi:hypothetical protein
MIDDDDLGARALVHSWCAALRPSEIRSPPFVRNTFHLRPR